MRRALLALALILPLAACQLSLPGRDRAADPAADPAANPVTGGTITTTTLDGPAPTVPPAAPVAAAATAKAPPPRPEPTAAAGPAPTPVPEPVATPAPKSDAQLACEDDGGSWVQAGDSGLKTCVFNTRDGGKSCDSRDDCDGECLARSRSCSPIKPLFGCNAVLMDTGAEVTLCID